MFYLERATTNSVVTGNSMSGALPPQSLQQISGREFSRHTFSPLLSQEAWWVAQYLGSILLGIKISVILPHLWDEVPSLKSSIASPSQGWWYPTAPTVLPPGLWEQGWTRWDNPWREAAEMWKHTFLCRIEHCLSTYPAGSPCALTAPFKWLQISPVSSAERTEIRYDFISVFIRPALDRAYTWQKCSLKNLFSEISACCAAASTGAERH